MRSGRLGWTVPLALATLLALAGCGDAALAPSASPLAEATVGAGSVAPPASASASPPVAPGSGTPSLAPPTAGATPASTPTRGQTPPPTPRPEPTPSASPRPTATPQLRVGRVAYVSVTVATGWHSPSSPRSVDAPALASPVRIRAWLSGLSTDQQAGLIGRVDTQVLLGDDVLVTELTEDWARVVVPDQATPLDRRGYPVWIPRRQLSAVAPAAPATAEVATIISPTAWLESQQGGQLAEASFGTRLPVLALTAVRVQVALPGGRSAWLPSASVSVRPRGEPTLAPSAASVVATARRFVGLRYLWGGTSGFGFDCSGIVYLVYRVHGIALPRDADPQSKVGVSVAAAARRPADLAFFTRNGEAHHVAIWVGGGAMLEAPEVGSPVRVVTLASLPYRNELTVTRRMLD
ncbi:MAG: C40 family peptidase [Candidatus Limnocylindrales bacterium]